MNPNHCITVTWGDVAENHTGNQTIGQKADSGFTEADMIVIYHNLINKGFTAEYMNIPLPEQAPPDTEKAIVIVVRNAVQKIFSPDPASGVLGSTQGITTELLSLNWDKKFYNARTCTVQNKIARHVLCFDDEHQDAHYEAGKGTIYAWNELPHMQYVKDYIPYMFGEKSQDLKAEGNYYYDVNQCGIGYHGDSERRKVIAMRLGASMPIYYEWYQPIKVGNTWKSVPCGTKYGIHLNNGDMYIMSQKAVGTDWKKRTCFTIRHATGCAKYTKV